MTGFNPDLKAYLLAQARESAIPLDLRNITVEMVLSFSKELFMECGCQDGFQAKLMLAALQTWKELQQPDAFDWRRIAQCSPPSPRANEAAKHFNSVAEGLTSQVESLKATLDAFGPESFGFVPFSSGYGKTQMAHAAALHLNKQSNTKACHIILHVAGEKDHTQPIYQWMTAQCWPLGIACAEDSKIFGLPHNSQQPDWPMLRVDAVDKRSWQFLSVLAKLLKLDDPMKLECSMDVNTFLKLLGTTKLYVFLDECNPEHPATLLILNAMRKMSSNVRCVLLGTNSKFSSLIAAATLSRGDHASSSYPWCHLIKPFDVVSISLPNNVPDALKLFLEHQCKHSRPLVGHRIREFFTDKQEKQENLNADHLQVLNDLVQYVGEQLIVAKMPDQNQPEYADWLYALVAMHQDVPNNTHKGVHSVVVHRHYGVLLLWDDLTTNHATIYRRGANLQLNEQNGPKVSRLAKFNGPQSEALLYLCMADYKAWGTKPSSGRKRPREDFCNTRVVFEQCLTRGSEKRVPSENSFALTNDGQALEALSATCMFLASARMGYKGNQRQLSKFIQLFLAEILPAQSVPSGLTFPKHFPSTMTVPLLSIANTNWPKSFRRIKNLKTASLRRPPNEEQVDVLVRTDKTSPVSLAVECKDRINLSSDVLKSIVEKSKSLVTLVVARKLQKKYFTKDGAPKFLQNQKVNILRYSNGNKFTTLEGTHSTPSPHKWLLLIEAHPLFPE